MADKKKGNGAGEAHAQNVRGVVKWFNANKGYGFITGQDGGEVFVHYSAIKSSGYKTLDEGDEVVYDVSKTTKGLQALNVQKA